MAVEIKKEEKKFIKKELTPCGQFYIYHYNMIRHNKKGNDVPFIRKIQRRVHQVKGDKSGNPPGRPPRLTRRVNDEVVKLKTEEQQKVLDYIKKLNEVETKWEDLFENINRG